MNNSSRKFEKIVSDRDRVIYEIVICGVIFSPICLFGMASNVINIVVFYKQGFKNTINISLLALAISDLCGLLTLLWSGICVNPAFVNSDVPIVPQEIQYLTGGASHTCFVRITGWITVFITAERCLCITLPLKIKRIITQKRTTSIICFIYIAMILTFLPEYTTSYFDWKFYLNRNKTLLGLAFRSNRKSVEGLIFVLYSASGTTSFIAVIVFTFVLAVHLKQKSRWRKKANLDTVRSETISVRDRKTVVMVVMIAIVLIVCYIPGVVVAMATFLEPELSIVGRYVNAFFVLWSFTFIFEAFNSSINIFVYYNMGTKYREAFRLMFGLLAQKHLRQQVKSECS